MVKGIVGLVLALALGVGSAAAEPKTVKEISQILFKAVPGVAPDLSHADLSGLDLSELDFKGAKLAGADLYGANLARANLSGTDLSSASLDHTIITTTNFAGANMEKATLYGTAVGGAAGAGKAINFIQTEMDKTMAYTGCNRVGEITTDIFFRDRESNRLMAG